IPKNWKITLPDFDSHYDELGYIDEDEDDDESGDSEDSAEVFWETDNDEEVSVKDSTKTVIQNITIKDSVIVGDVANAVPDTEDD
ncbi:MAG: hypothetical protein CMA92_04755, partial [Euryarchaeota archaeon]|nr:hypothetical protein [Euryarchaeota archaeon]